MRRNSSSRKNLRSPDIADEKTSDNSPPMKVDILVLASHPDDAELGCGGVIAKHTRMGQKVAIVDLTRGELGTRGTPETRHSEAAESARILGVAARENLALPDGFFQNNAESQLTVIRAIRKYQPRIILTNAVYDRHVDHGKGANLAYDASFLSGLIKIETHDEGKKQTAWRPEAVYHFVQRHICRMGDKNEGDQSVWLSVF